MTHYWIAGIGCVALVVIFHQKILDDLKLLRTDKKQWLYLKWKNWGEPFLVAGIMALMIRSFLLGPYKIPTGSMKPTFLEGDRIFVDKISYRFREPERGDIIVFKYPLDKKKDFVKRLVAFPGEKVQIQDGKLIVNGRVLDHKPFTDHYYYNRPDWQFAKENTVIDVPEEAYFVLGDNSAQSSDSRNWGFVPAKNLVGRAFFIWWPLNRLRLVD